MAIPIKLLLIKEGDKLGNGLAAIRERSSEFIDITNFELGMSDPTSTGNPNYVIKDNKIYRMIKTYFDIDNTLRIVLAKEDIDSYDIWPLSDKN